MAHSDGDVVIIRDVKEVLCRQFSKWYDRADGACYLRCAIAFCKIRLLGIFEPHQPDLLILTMFSLSVCCHYQKPRPYDVEK